MAEQVMEAESIETARFETSELDLRMGIALFSRAGPDLRTKTVNELIVVNDSCPRCGVGLLESDNFCSNCGLPTEVDAYPNVPAVLVEPCPEAAIARSVPTAMAPAASPVVAMLDNRLLVVAIVLCAGPMGLPALWFSRRFSQRTKILTTIAYLLMTTILPLAIAWYFLEVAVRPVVDALGG